MTGYAPGIVRYVVQLEQDVLLNMDTTAVRLAHRLDPLQAWFYQHHLVGKLWVVS
jgi:hypothetical protein